ncbi:hypothetical protein CMI37_23150, partial [Candidatus Pacearchaeota archaeon]|nr:hypothetical protein [Candidatus Pacearchaeota archaeon]
MVILVGKNIRKVRLVRGLTQTEAAHKVGWNSQARWSYLEGSESNPTLQVVEAIAEVLEVDPWVLLLDHQGTLMQCVCGVPLLGVHRAGSGSKHGPGVNSTP